MHFSKQIFSLFILFFITHSIYAHNRSTSVNVFGIVHVQNIGDVSLKQKSWVGPRDSSLSLEAFSLNINKPYAFLHVDYMCHIQDSGDTPWLRQGELCGTRGQARRLEGFAIRLSGKAAREFTVKYQCRLQDQTFSDVLEDGEFCGTKGESLGIESLRVWIEKR